MLQAGFEFQGIESMYKSAKNTTEGDSFCGYRVTMDGSNVEIITPPKPLDDWAKNKKDKKLVGIVTLLSHIQLDTNIGLKEKKHEGMTLRASLKNFKQVQPQLNIDINLQDLVTNSDHWMRKLSQFAVAQCNLKRKTGNEVVCYGDLMKNIYFHSKNKQESSKKIKELNDDWARELTLQELVGADLTIGSTKFNPTKTKEYLEKFEEIASNIENMDIDYPNNHPQILLLVANKNLERINKNITDISIKNWNILLKGYVLVLCMGQIKALGGGALTKDMPLLPKVDMIGFRATIMNKCISSEFRMVPERPNVSDLLDEMVHRIAAQACVHVLTATNLKSYAKANVFDILTADGVHEGNSHGDLQKRVSWINGLNIKSEQKKSAKWDGQDELEQQTILVELRRASCINQEHIALYPAKISKVLLQK
ncbi:hypothetical protein SBX64_15980 [Vibrio rhizosphaerae]|uniref:Uncharacterized protein n=1 Tax=Vibrio rhizosphaerae TaxID=398736 RepID=A0ABU4J0K8_9VIBR|nr:hypothetical protein [Vibrio rhizosphaerae]MDW6094038.1 hypothetical protein [Vibrio rhizosphaerae]